MPLMSSLQSPLASETTSQLPRSHSRSQSTNSTHVFSTPVPSPPLSRRNSNSPELFPSLDRYQIAEDICKEMNFYKILGVRRTSTLEEIRKAYISKSRMCHPDKLRGYSKATEAFQKLSVAYDTLSKPSSRRVYDLSGGLSHGKSGRPGGSEIGSDEDATLNAVIYQLLEEFMTSGDFDCIRSFIMALNETTPGLDIGDDVIQGIEATFRKLRDISLVATKYIRLVKFELMKLYEMQYQIRKLSYFDVYGRLTLTIRISKLILSIPIVINVASRVEGPMERELCYDETGGQGNGIFGDRVERLLRMMIAMLDATEKWVVST